MPIFVAHDSRVSGSISSEEARNRNFLYHQYTPANHLSDIVRDFNRDFDRYFSIQSIAPSARKLDMAIWAHGLFLPLFESIGGITATARSVYGIRLPSHEEIRHINEGGLGYGIDLCFEVLSLATIHHLEVLRGKINTLTLMVCGAANISHGRTITELELQRLNETAIRNSDHPRGSLNYSGNGHQLCSALASRLSCTVEASTESQRYSPVGMNFGYREGLWVTYAPDGRLNRTARRYRSIHVDRNGVVHGNDTDPDGHTVSLD